MGDPRGPERTRNQTHQGNTLTEHTPTASRFPVQVAIVGLLFVVAVGAVVLALRNPGPAPAIAGTTGKSLDDILNAVLVLKRDSENAKAEAILRQAVLEHPGEQRLFIEYAEVLGAMGRTEESLANYDKALAIGPRDAPLEFAAGTTASMLGKLDQAEAHYAAAQAADKTDWKAPLFLAQIQLKLNTPEKTEEAKKNLLIAANLKPDAATPWGTLADIALRDNKPSLALQHVAKARELEPRVTLWRVIQARALKRENKPEEALNVLIGLDDAQRREPGVLQTMAECYGMLNRPKDAAALYTRASDKDISNGPWALEAGLWLEKSGEKDRALIYATRAAGESTPGADELLARLRTR